MNAVLSALSSLGRETARIVLHASCVVCDRELPWRERKASCCRSCWSALPAISGAKCQSCALTLPPHPASGHLLPASGEKDVQVPSPREAGRGCREAAGEGCSLRCIACLDDPLPVGWTEAWGHYRGSLERLLHAFKFERHDFLDRPLAELLEDVLRARGDIEFDAIVPVPMHRSKIRRRGYNQAELLASALARRLPVRCQPSLLVKRREGRPQSTLPRSERAANVRASFLASPRAGGRSVLLVDDVCTTGETLRACSHALLREGAARVCAIVVAKA